MSFIKKFSATFHIPCFIHEFLHLHIWNLKAYLYGKLLQNQIRCELKVMSQTSPPGHLSSLAKTQIQLLLQQLEPMPWYTH